MNRLASFTLKIKEMRRIPLYAYVASNNPNGAAGVIEHFKLPAPRNQNDIARGLRYVMMTQGEEGFHEIAKVHPDRNLILDVNSLEAKTEENKSSCDGNCSCNEKKSNACGCSSGFDGSENNAPNQDEINKLKEEKTLAKLEGIEKASLTKDDVAKEVKKALKETNTFIRDSLPTIAVIGVGAFLFMGILKN